MTETRHPALVDVLVALSGDNMTRDQIERAKFRLLFKGSKVYAPFESMVSGWYLRFEDTADAVEALVGAGLLPAPWADPDRAPQWWCDKCDGRGLGDRMAVWCTHCEGVGHRSAPCNFADLVAVASMGVDTLARAEAIVAEAWSARVMWRVLGEDGMAKHHEETLRERPSRRPIARPRRRATLWRSAGAAVVMRPGLDAGTTAYYAAHELDVRPLIALRDAGFHLLVWSVGAVTLGVVSVP